MKNTLHEKSEKIKNNIKNNADKSKETIRELIDSNNRYIGAALDANKKIVDSIKEQLKQKDIDDSITDTLKQTFGKSIEVAEDALDSIINSYMRQMELNVDFNTKLIDAINESDNKNPEKLLNLIHDNYEASRNLTIKNTKEILDFYNKHTNLAVNFNEKFGENINAQLELLFKIQRKGLNKFTEWASDWWEANENGKIIKQR